LLGEARRGKAVNSIAEFKRRNVIRLAGLYLVGAWLTTQVAATLSAQQSAMDRIVVAHIHWHDAAILGKQLQRDAVRQIDRDRMQVFRGPFQRDRTYRAIREPLFSIGYP